MSTGDACPDDGLFCNGVESCDEDADTCESSGDPCPGDKMCDEQIDECRIGNVLILYDNYDGPWNYGPMFANMIGNLVTHFGFGYKFVDAGQFQAGDLNGFDYAVYVGSVYANVLSPDFLQAVSDRVVPVFWINYNLWQIAWDPIYNSDWGFWYLYGVAESDYGTVSYKEQSFDRHELYEEYNLVEVLDPARASVKAWLVSDIDPADQVPYIMQGDGLWYCTDNPFGWLTDGNRYVVFADQLGEFLGYQPHHGMRAMVRFEDNAPVVSDPQKLLQIGYALYEGGIPFAIGVIPVFKDPLGEYYPQPVEYRLSDDPEFVAALKALEGWGGTLLLHGYTHQYDGVTGDDYEFWMEGVNTPVPEDSVEWVQDRLDASLAECHSVGIYPEIWETPHYSASQLDTEVFYANFDSGYERTRVFNNFDSNPGDVIVHKDAGFHSNKKATAINWLFPAIEGCEDMTLEEVRSRYFLSAGAFSPSGSAEAGDEDVYVLQYVTFGVPRSIYGNAWIPENMGYLDPGVVEPEDLLAVSAKYAVTADPVASFFYHHDYPQDIMAETIEGMQAQGYQFISAQELVDSMQE